LKKKRIENLAGRRVSPIAFIIGFLPNPPAHNVVQKRSIWVNINFKAVLVLSINSSSGRGSDVRGSFIKAF
jgi:hypothetical protein